MAQKYTHDDNPLVPKDWTYVYWHNNIMTPDWSGGTSVQLHYNVHEAIGHAFYTSDVSTMTSGNYSGFSMPNTAVYYVYNASTLTMYPTVPRVGGLFFKDNLNDPSNPYDVFGDYTWYPVPYFDQSTNLSDPDMNPAVAYQTNNQTNVVGFSNGFQYYVPQGPIECYFWNRAGEQEWASGCYGVVTCGINGSYLELDILGKDGSTIRTFGLNFGWNMETVLNKPGDVYTWYYTYYMTVDPATEQNVDHGVFTTTWVRPPYWDSYEAGIDAPPITATNAGVPNNYYLRAYGSPTNGAGGRGQGSGTIEFTYLGTCAGFRVRKAAGLEPADYLGAYPRDFWVSGVGKKVAGVPPLRWNQRNDGEGIMDFSERWNSMGTQTKSSTEHSNRLALGANTYE